MGLHVGFGSALRYLVQVGHCFPPKQPMSVVAKPDLNKLWLWRTVRILLVISFHELLRSKLGCRRFPWKLHMEPIETLASERWHIDWRGLFETKWVAALGIASMSSVEALKLAVGRGMPKMQAQKATGHSVSLNMESQLQTWGCFNSGIIKSSSCLKNHDFAWRPFFRIHFETHHLKIFTFVPGCKLSMP